MLHKLFKKLTITIVFIRSGKDDQYQLRKGWAMANGGRNIVRSAETFRSLYLFGGTYHSWVMGMYLG